MVILDVGKEDSGFVVIALIAAIIITSIYRIILTSAKGGRGYRLFPYLMAKLSDGEVRILENWFDYYNNLPNEKLKSLFRKRVAYFIRIKKFIPAGGLSEINSEMKVLISASAAQLAFGYPNVYLMHFSTIIIFPAEFTLSDKAKEYDGKVDLRGAIFLSWKSFVTGYKFPQDGRNLGLHELAHALYFENAYKNTEYDFIDHKALQKFAVLTKKELLKMQNGETTIFREYASKNRHEFFAVAVESFFERPVEFRQNHPDLYNTLAVLLNQDTAEKKYILKK
jgi:MtfA peptidase